MTRTRAHSSSSRRKAAALLLVLLFQGALGAEAFAVRGCPHHHPDRSPASPQSVDAPPTAVAGLEAPPAPQDGSAPAHCSCVGDCGAGAAVLLPGTPAVSVVPRPAAREHASPPTPRPVPLRRAPYLLPFPNGPPLA